jgi:hypothetical protein
MDLSKNDLWCDFFQVNFSRVVFVDFMLVDKTEKTKKTKHARPHGKSNHLSDMPFQIKCSMNWRTGCGTINSQRTTQHQHFRVQTSNVKLHTTRVITFGLPSSLPLVFRLQVYRTG